MGIRNPSKYRQMFPGQGTNITQITSFNQKDMRRQAVRATSSKIEVAEAAGLNHRKIPTVVVVGDALSLTLTGLVLNQVNNLDIFAVGGSDLCYSVVSNH